MKSFSQLPPDEALRRLEDGGFDAVKDRYLALKALGPGADAEVDSIEYDMKKFASKAQELKAK